MGVRTQVVRSGWSGAGGGFLFAAAAQLFLSLISYNAGDVRVLQMPPNDPPHNLIGPMGAWSVFVLFFLSIVE